MSSTNETSKDAVWEMIDREKKKDIFVNRVSKISWGVTLVALIAALVFFGIELSSTMGLYKRGVVAYADVLNIIFTMVKLVGIFGFIIAIISTVGVFLRLRTTSLLEIQQRLANLEQMVVAKK